MPIREVHSCLYGVPWLPTPENLLIDRWIDCGFRGKVCMALS